MLIGNKQRKVLYRCVGVKVYSFEPFPLHLQHCLLFMYLIHSVNCTFLHIYILFTF